MDKIDVEILIIDDTPNLEEDNEFIFELTELYRTVTIKPSPEEGLDYFSEHKNKKLIIILDYKFSKTNGISILKSIKDINKVVPIILWTANADVISTEEYETLINEHTFGIFPKAPYEPIISKINDAVKELSSSIEIALEEWINIAKEDPDKPYLITANGKQYTLNDLLHEIQMRTELGEQIVKDMHMLTIDLLLRNREKLND